MSTKRVLQSTDEGFRLLFQDNPQPMWVFDRQALDFLEVNAEALKLYGYTREEFLGMRLTDIRQEQLSTATNAWRHRLKDGRTIDVEVNTQNIAYGGRKAALTVLIDVTGHNLLEAQLRQAQKMEAVGLLAGGVAHDFNNLLTIITGYSQLVLNSLPEGDRNRSSVEQIIKAGERAAALTRQLLAFSRRQVLQPKVLALNTLVGGLAVMLRRLIGEDIDLQLDLQPDLGRVSADPGQIEQVIMNLVVNSRDAMPKGGTLTIESANVELDESYAATHLHTKPGSYVMLAVSDTGTGMDAATRARLFEPFFTTKGLGRGTGLGLSTAFGIVRQSGGNVEVYSEAGAGTSVKVYLPRVDQPAAAEVEGPVAHGARGTETILVVEDEDMVRKLVRETLENAGYQVLDAAGSEEAQRAWEAHQGAIQLLITDVVLPKDSGRTLAARLTAIRPDMKVLYMSGYTDSAIIASGALTSEMYFLQKPFTPAMLARKVREVLQADDGGKCRHAGG